MAETRSRSTRSSRGTLSRDRILRAAARIADTEGIEAITMRRVARALGVEAMSLYNHVASKDEVLDGIADMVMREVALPAEPGPWRDALRSTALSAHDALRRHPWACALIMSPLRDVPTRMDYMEAVLSLVRGAGFSPDDAFRAYHAYDSHILGFTMWEIGHSPGTTDLAGAVGSFLEQLPTDAYPHLAEHARLHLTAESRTVPSEFEFGLDLILDGLARMLRGRVRRRR